MVTHKIVNGNYKIVNGNYRIVNGKIVNGTARPPLFLQKQYRKAEKKIPIFSKISGGPIHNL